MGFSKLIKSCENIKSLKPLAVVHDALVLDIKESELEDFKQIVNKGIDLKGLGKFYLGVETYERWISKRNSGRSSFRRKR